MTTKAAAELYLAQHRNQTNSEAVIHNPKSSRIDELPKIYAFSNAAGGGDGIAYAMADDGTVLGSHWCSHEGYVEHDLAVNAGCRDDRHEAYRAHYPNGYVMEFVPASEVKRHAGLMAAFEKNQLLGNAAKARGES